MKSSGDGCADYRPRRAVAQQHTRRPNQNVILVGLLAGLAAMIGGGVWWVIRGDDTERGNALHQFQTADVHSLAFDLGDVDALYFGHHGGLMISADGGRSWREGSLRNADAMQQSLALADPPRHYVAGHDVFTISTDGGATWRDQPNNLPSLDLHTFAGSPTDANRLYAIPAGLGLWTSSDGGATWSEMMMPPSPDTQPVALSVAPNVPETIFLTRNGAVWVSDDAGQTWREETGPPGIITSLAVAADANETRYAGTNQGVFRRGANGVWERLPVEPQGMVLAVAISPVDVQRVAIVDREGNLYRSDDGGENWE